MQGVRRGKLMPRNLPSATSAARKGPWQFLYIWWNSATSIILFNDHPLTPTPRVMSVSQCGESGHLLSARTEIPLFFNGFKPTLVSNQPIDTGVLHLPVGNWQCVPTWTGTEGILPRGSNGCCYWGDKLYSLYCAASLEVLTDLTCLTSSLSVPCQAWETSN